VNDAYYAQLARALLDVGDTAPSVARFLRVEYGLESDESKRAVAQGRGMKVEKTENSPGPRPRGRARARTTQAH
jgi:hypothetical protein